MTDYHPLYGKLLNSKRVSELTGYTTNQLRYFKRFPEKSPLPMVKIGGTTLYREADVEMWLKENGVSGVEYIVPDGAKHAELLDSSKTSNNSEHFASMSKIKTNNAWSKVSEGLLLSGAVSPIEAAYKFLEDETARLYKLKYDIDLREKHPGKNMDAWLRMNDPQAFWEANCYGTRSLARTVHNWDLTDEDILNAPVGDLIPVVD